MASVNIHIRSVIKRQKTDPKDAEPWRLVHFVTIFIIAQQCGSTYSQNSAVTVGERSSLVFEEGFYWWAFRPAGSSMIAWTKHLNVGINRHSEPSIDVSVSELSRMTLDILSSRSEDGGMYTFSNKTQQGDIKGIDLQLIVLDADPICDVVMVDNITNISVISCSVTYTGNWAPVMQWALHGRTIIHAISSCEQHVEQSFMSRHIDAVFDLDTNCSRIGNSVRLQSALTLRHNMTLKNDGIFPHLFQCRTFFRRDERPGNIRTHPSKHHSFYPLSNVPSYEYTCDIHLNHSNASITHRQSVCYYSDRSLVSFVGQMTTMLFRMNSQNVSCLFSSNMADNNSKGFSNKSNNFSHYGTFVTNHFNNSVSLTIMNTSLDDAGIYYCSDVDGGNIMSRQLIVIESPPQCQSTGLNATESDTQLSCRVAYRGGNTPVMQWNHDDVIINPHVLEASTDLLTSYLNVERNMSILFNQSYTDRYLCRTYFTLDNTSASSYLDLAPVYQHVCHVDVMWPDIQSTTTDSSQTENSTINTTVNTDIIKESKFSIIITSLYIFFAFTIVVTCLICFRRTNRAIRSKTKVYATLKFKEDKEDFVAHVYEPLNIVDMETFSTSERISDQPRQSGDSDDYEYFTVPGENCTSLSSEPVQMTIDQEEF